MWKKTEKAPEAALLCLWSVFGPMRPQKGNTRRLSSPSDGALPSVCSLSHALSLFNLLNTSLSLFSCILFLAVIFGFFSACCHGDFLYSVCASVCREEPWCMRETWKLPGRQEWKKYMSAWFEEVACAVWGVCLHTDALVVASNVPDLDSLNVFWLFPFAYRVDKATDWYVFKRTIHWMRHSFYK